MMLADKTIPELFGTIKTPTGIIGGGDPIADLGKFLGFAVNLFLTVAGLASFLYLLWGAFDWIISGGEKEKIQKAQNKITDAVIGLVLVFVVFAVFGLLAGDLLGVIKNVPGQGWQIIIPTLQ